MIQSDNSSSSNLKSCNWEFCVMWRCSRYEMEYPCTHCSVIEDVNAMAKALHVKALHYEYSTIRVA